MAEGRDLVTMLYEPRETIRRVLDTAGPRWTTELIALAFIVTSFGDPDVRRIPRELPDLTLVPTLAFVALVLIATAICWVLVFYALAWLVTMVGRRLLDGQGVTSDVRAALAWALVPMVWSIVFRIPLAIYRSQLTITGTNSWQITLDLLQSGTLSIALVAAALKFVLFLWVIALAAINVGEAMRFETWKGLSALAVVAVAPFVIVAAAILAKRF
jgi:hypothetical protein